jgi:hypothetical protein
MVETTGESEHVLLTAQLDAAMLTKAVLPRILFDVGHGTPQRISQKLEMTMIRGKRAAIIIELVANILSAGNWATDLIR